MDEKCNKIIHTSEKKRSSGRFFLHISKFFRTFAADFEKKEKLC